MKKSLSLLLMSAMLVSVCIPALVSAEATAEPALSENAYDVVIDSYVEDDGTVVLWVTVENALVQLQALEAKLYYDSTLFTVDNYISGDGTVDCIFDVPSKKWENLTSLKSDANGSYIAINLCNATDASYISPETPLELEFIFAPNTEYTTASFEIPTDSVQGFDPSLVYHYGSGCAITVEAPVETTLYGDVNGDGEINGMDAARLLRYLAEFDDETGTCSVEIFEGADCNEDGVINGKDAVRLLRYLADAPAD